MTGKQIPAREFNNGALDIFTTYVWPDFQRDHVGRQGSFNIEGFEGDVYYTKSRPIEIKSNEALHLARKEDTRVPVLGMTASQADRLDRNLEILRIEEVKHELEALGGAS